MNSSLSPVLMWVHVSKQGVSCRDVTVLVARRQQQEVCDSVPCFDVLIRGSEHH